MFYIYIPTIVKLASCLTRPSHPPFRVMRNVLVFDMTLGRDATWTRRD